jgi:hypothetical protein
MQSNVIGIPVFDPSGANLKTFPNLGAFPGEVGNGLSPGGVSAPGNTWIMGIAPGYWFNYGTKRSNKKSYKRSHKKSNKKFNKRSNKRACSVRSKKFKKILSKKIAINMKEYKKGRWKSRPQVLAVSYAQAKKLCSK